MGARELDEQQQQLMKTLYELGVNTYFHEVYVHRLGQQFGLGTVQYQKDREGLAKLASELEEAGYVRKSPGRYVFFFEYTRERLQSERRVESFDYLSLTDEGRREVEDNLL
jgi:Mn-dependent DtxR family transcriptional regulator